MKNSTTLRNLIGGFLGGFTGIQASWLINPEIVSLIVGTVLGTIIGWYNKEIINLFKKAHKMAKGKASGLVTNKTDCFVAWTRRNLSTTPANLFLRATTIVVKGNHVVVKVFNLTINALVKTANNTFSAPRRFRQWLAKHPINKATVIEATTTLLFIPGITTLIFFICQDFGVKKENIVGITIFSLILAACGAFSYLLRSDFNKNYKLSSLSKFYRNWEIISQYGPIGFFFYTLGMLIRYTIGLTIFSIIAIPWFLTIATIGFLGVYPLIFIVFVAHGFYHLASRTDHSFCLGVTLAVTIISWFIYHENFADPRVLWSISLGTGIISGAITEITCRFILPLFNTKIGHKLTSTDKCHDLIFNTFNEGSLGYLDLVVFKFGGSWFRQNHPARILRAVCFSTPVAQPVRIFDSQDSK